MVIGNSADKKLKSNLNVTALKSRRVIARVIIFIMIIFVLSSLYLISAWNRYRDEASSKAISLANSIGAVLPKRHISQLSGTEKDLDRAEYKSIKQDLSRLVETANTIRFAYLMAQRSGNIIFLVDSESPDSPDYSPPGQVYEEAADVDREPFRTGQTTLTKPMKDRWGTWVSVLVPIKDKITGNVIAVFGIDYSASEWYAQIWENMIHDILIIIFVILLSFSLLFGWIQYDRNKLLSKKIAVSEAFYRTVFDEAPVGIAIVNDDGFVHQSVLHTNSINRKFEQILGRTRDELENVSWMDITHPDDLEADLDKFENFRKGEINGYTMEKRYLKPDGSIIWVNMIISTFSDVEDRAYGHICIIQDLSKSREMENQLKESERKMAVLLSHLPGMAYRCCHDHDWTMQFVSDGCYKLTGYSPESILSNKDISFNEIITSEYRDVLWNEWINILATKQPFEFEYEIQTASGERKWVLEMGQGVFNEEGGIDALEGIILDITDRKVMENNLRYVNEHDESTGLYNRDYLESLLENDAKTHSSQKRAVVGINLSTVNLLTANYGFHYTQNLIKSAADALSKYCTDKCMLFKTFENRFVFYLKDYKDKSELIEFCESIAKTLEDLFVTDRIGGRIDILEIGEDKELDADLLLKRLLIASERVINIFNKDFSYYFYSDELEDLVNREGEIRQELSRIASSDDCEELFLEYQPILDLKTNTICGFEALARLNSEKLGLVSPLEFIPIAEKTKLIIPIGEKVFIKALSFLNRLKEQGFDTINMSINVSVVQLLTPGFIDRVLGIINEMHANPKTIGIEITESVFSLDYKDINSNIGKLRGAGLHIAIDDFGTGYSSLAREKELSVNCLKIDKYFIDKLANPEKAITRDIISMAHRLGHCVIAEGVEYEYQKQYLIDHSCDKIQGYLIAKPLDEEATIELLKNQPEFLKAPAI